MRTCRIVRNKANERKASVENGSNGSLSNSGNSNGTLSPLEQLHQPVDSKPSILVNNTIVHGINSNTYSINGILGIEHRKYQNQQQQRQTKRKNPDGKRFCNN